MKRLLPGLAGLLLLAAGAKEDVALKNGDKFRISLAGVPWEFTEEYNQLLVVEGGKVSIPNLGWVKAAGLSATALAGTIEKELQQRKIFTNPRVTLSSGDASLMVIQEGALHRPAYFRGMTLGQAVNLASGMDPFGPDRIWLTRKGQVTVYSRRAIRKDPAQDPELLPGDTIKLAGEF